MRVRMTALPRRGELDEFDLHRLHVGDVYDLPPRLASILLIGGYAEPATPVAPDGAAPRGGSHPRRPAPEF